MKSKNAPRDRTAAEWKSAAVATRRRQRILRAVKQKVNKYRQYIKQNRYYAENMV